MSAFGAVIRLILTARVLRALLLVVGFALVTWWAFSSSPVPPPAPPPAPLLHLTPPPPALERFVHDLVNDHRTGLGLKPLEYRQELAVIAHVHSLAMATYTTPYGHGGFDDRARRADNFMPAAGFAENVAMLNHRGQGGEAKAVVRGWLQSPGHRENIEGDFSLTGIGISQSWDGTYYFTQLFMRPAAGQFLAVRSMRIFLDYSVLCPLSYRRDALSANRVCLFPPDSSFSASVLPLVGNSQRCLLSDAGQRCD